MFLSLIKAETADRSPWGDFWFEPVTTRTLAGARVSPETAMRLSAVYACVSLLSRTFAVLPFVLYRPKKGGGKEKITDHWLYRLLAKKPNRYQNAFEWREMMQGHLTLRGNCYNRIFANSRGEVTELVPVHPDRIKIEVLEDGDYRYRIYHRNGRQEIVARGEIWHVRGFSSDGLIGLSPIDTAREVVGLGLSAQEYASRFFANDARPTAGWIKMTGKFANDEARKVFRESWQRAQAGENRGKVPVLEEGMEYQDPPAVSLKDMQFLELRGQSVGDIARIYGVQPHMIGDLSKATNNNIEQQSLEFVVYTMTPWAERWEAAIEDAFIFEDDDLEIEFDFKNLLRGDMAARGAYYKNGIFGGYLTRNEVRDSEGLDPIEGLDEPLQPLNMVEAGSEPPALPGAAKKPAAPDGETGTTDDSADARLAALASAAVDRIARRELRGVEKELKKEGAVGDRLTEFYRGHASFVMGALNVAYEAAEEYGVRRTCLLSNCEGDLDEDVFLDTARAALMHLALKGKR